MRCGVKRQKAKVKRGSQKVKSDSRKPELVNPPLKGDRTTKSFRGMTARTFFSDTNSRLSVAIPLRPLRRGSSLQALLVYVFIIFASLLTLSSCTDSFQALEENDQYYFSMYGYLDASADTQWVRVTPAREQVDALEEVPEMTVSVENLDSGDTIMLNDSLFQNSGASYINFWTTEPIQHNQSYRIVAKRPDGSTSHATVNTPGELPTPRVIIQTSFGFPTTYSVEVDASVHVADVQSKWYVRIKAPNLDSRRIFTFSYRNDADTTEAGGGSYSYQLKPEEELNDIEAQVLLPDNGEIEVVHRQIFVASTGSEWVSGVSSLSDLEYAIPETFSNVENGVGFVTGIDSKYVPYESCENESQTQIVPCPEEKEFW